MRSYDIALGLVPEGEKVREGDFKTPEGDYLLTNRLLDSKYFLAIQVSYPGPGNIQYARRLGVRPGGQIMIHGQPNEPKHSNAFYEREDWTNGCIAVSNAAMVEIWQLTRVNTPVTIEP
jgi:murein L,D-transpeptidase YafK